MAATKGELYIQRVAVWAPRLVNESESKVNATAGELCVKLI